MTLSSYTHFNSSLPSGFILNSKILFALSLRLNFLIIKTFFIRLTSITVPISAMPLKNISSSGFEFIMLMNFVATITHSRFLNSLNRYLMLSSFEFISSGSIESITSLFILYFVTYFDIYETISETIFEIWSLTFQISSGSPVNFSSVELPFMIINLFSLI